MFKCSCHRMKCDKGSDAWNKFEDITHPCSSYISWPPRTAKDKRGVGESLAKNFFGEDVLFRVKEFRTTLICTVWSCMICMIWDMWILKTSCMFFVDRCQQEQKCQAYKSWSKGAKEESVVTHDEGLPVGFDHEWSMKRSLKLTANLPLKIGWNPKGKERIVFQPTNFSRHLRFWVV